VNKSINGWAVIESRSDKRLKTLTVPGTERKLTMHEDVVALFCALAADYHKEVAPLRAGECGAYAYRKARMADAYSDHSSGTAIDLNWNHEGAMGPNGGMKKKMTPEQIKACAKIKKRYKVVIWGGDKARGGDYGKPENWDPMHYALKSGVSVEDIKKVLADLNINKQGVRNPVEKNVEKEANVK